ncbi:MAG: helicase-related protein [Syntrophobacteraceae bacterium]
MAVRLFEKGFLHAKAYLFYVDRIHGMEWDRLKPLVGMVGSSNFTGAGLIHNKELNLIHKGVIEEEEVDDPLAAEMASHNLDKDLLPDYRKARHLLSSRGLDESPLQMSFSDLNSAPVEREIRRGLKSEVGARAIYELAQWFEGVWERGRDFKDGLIEILDESKFGTVEYSPYQIYLKALWEYFQDDLRTEDTKAGIFQLDLAEFQFDAVKKARKIIARYDGVMIADSVGLGKTWIGKQILLDYAYHARQKCLVICPAQLRDTVWSNELAEDNIPAQICSMEAFGQADFDGTPWADADLVLIDESHNFRNKDSQRYQNLENLLSLNGRRGRSGSRKKVVLLTATPINNDLLDLYYQINLITGGDDSTFAAAGIGNLRKYFLRARRLTQEQKSSGNTRVIFNLLEEIVIRRTRQFIKKTYPEAKIRDKIIRFPERKLGTIRYDLENIYRGIYGKIVSGIESLNLVPFNMDFYLKEGSASDDAALAWRIGRGQALVGLFKCLYLKRFESSVEAFRISLARMLEFLKTYQTLLDEGIAIRSDDFRKMMSLVKKGLDEEDEGTASEDASKEKFNSRAEDIKSCLEARAYLDSLNKMDLSGYRLKEIMKAMTQDITIMEFIYDRLAEIKPEQDSKLQRVKNLLRLPSTEQDQGGHFGLRGQKVLIFTYFKDTAKYLRRNLVEDETFLQELGNPKIRIIDSDNDSRDRKSIVQQFAPKSNRVESIAGTKDEIQILVSTDVLSEGQNLQDCARMINYDLHWNPTRMVQRAGRIDRIGTNFDLLYIYNIFPDAGLEKLLGLVERLTRKIGQIDDTIGLDASILGEAINPKTFNTLKRIESEDASVIEEEEELSELATNEFMLQKLQEAIQAGLEEEVKRLPDGIHSGLHKPGAKGIFWYFKGPPPREGATDLHIWKYYDLKTQTIIDNRLDIGGLIACQKETPRVVSDYDIFAIMEGVIEDILQGEKQQRSLEAVPKNIDPIQNTVATALMSRLNGPGVDRNQIRDLLFFLKNPVTKTQAKRLKAVYSEFQKGKDFQAFIASIEEMKTFFGEVSEEKREGTELRRQLSREDLYLVCFDLLS